MSMIEQVESPAVQAPVSKPSILDPRVERGAALLDKKRAGWADRVDPDKLQLSSTCNCVLGLLCGSYFEGRVGLGLTWNDGQHYGFDTFAGQADEYARLEQDWRLAILSRRVLDTADPSGSSPTAPKPSRVVARHREAGTDG